MGNVSEQCDLLALKNNPANPKLNFAEIKKKTTLCLEYTFDFFNFYNLTTITAYVLRKIA